MIEVLKYRAWSHVTRLSIFSGLCIVIAFTSISVTAQSKALYRYTQESGNVVISDSIPPKYASQGYEIIDSRGNIIETVPKELSDAEKEQQRAAREEAARLAKWDKELLARYSRVEDIESRKERRMAGLKNSIESLKLTLKNITNTISYYQAEAAADERQGEVVAEETLASIARLQRDKAFISNEIARKEKEQTEINDGFDQDIARFKIIKASNNER